ncbi:MAG: glycosyltransferase family 4 protein [Candidatus Kerfeldbacteria bacterium]|nr:glycosyltransferase family 4 protein [Candidatus Kerfeldbacteria bacterium]
MVIGIDASRANLRERTGTERYALTVVTALIKQRPQTSFILYLDHSPIPELQHLGPNVKYRVLAWPPRFLWSQLRLSWEMLRRPPDVLFIPAHTMPIIHPRRTVVTIHDIGFERFPELYGRSPIAGHGMVGRLLNILVRTITLGQYGANELDYHRWSARFAARHAAQIITVSSFTKQELANLYHIGEERVTVTHSGINASEFVRPPTDKIKLTIDAFKLRPPYVVYIGRLEKKKGMRRLIEIFAEARKTVPKLELVLIGKPGLGWEEVDRQIRSIGLSSQVHTLGWQPDQVSVPLLAGAEALLFLSRYEGFGLPLLESFCVGTPVLASDIPALREIGQDAVLFCDPDDIKESAEKLRLLINNNGLRSSLVTHGRQRLSLFSWKRTAEETGKALERA